MSLISACNKMVKTIKNFLCIQQNCSSISRRATTWDWDVSNFICDSSIVTHYAVLVLNRPLTQDKDFLKKLWNKATLRIVVDGGAGRWDSYTAKLQEDIRMSLRIPDFVTGDFDSISKDTLEKYTQQGSKIIHTPDQNHTDFTKALMEIKKHCNENQRKIDHVVALAQASGRIDQILGNIQTLFLAKEQNLLGEANKIFLISDDSFSWLLEPGDHVICIPENIRNHSRTWCSLVPIGESCAAVTTSGLKWDLENRELKFGQLVSTSNAFSGSETVTVKCSHTLLWSMKVPDLISI